MNNSYTIKKAAAYYIAKGLYVVPLIKHSKKPAIEDWPNMAYSITPDEFRQYNNIGILLGTKLPNGNYLTALDIEKIKKDDMINWARKTFSIRGSVKQYTVSGGEHYFIQTDKPVKGIRVNDDKNNCLIELRGEKQYVVAGPSYFPGGRKSFRYCLSFDINDLEYVPSDLLIESFNKLKNNFDSIESNSRNKTLQSTPISENRLLLNQLSYKLSCENQIEDLLTDLNINYIKEANWLMVSCPIHPPDKNPSFAINRAQGFSIDYHTGEKYNLIETLSFTRGKR